ncbi:HAMP domain-containing histidine kinase [Schaalia sp. 19OD2882]|uniref:sensor histidine kinase n=1 Tax=Schaalia sp. 19OD2882 TaxID=2794089 RepID=UPI001C1F0B80|nr:HAMP domain-containing sensor histidine kinase [Schaalia sp. 19OD2882]QWW19002.1 HAMP domain-containing histidine kinase [Schaalia sp. 19OD2882]
MGVAQGARGITIRTRIMWAMFVVAACALGTSGTMVTVLHVRSSDAEVTEHLLRVRTQVQDLASGGVDPWTGRPFSDPAAVVRTHLAHSVLGPDEGELGFQGERLRWVPAKEGPMSGEQAAQAPPEGFQPEGDTELMAALTPMLRGSDSVVDSVTTSSAHYRVLLVPVRAAGESATLVRVVDLDRRNAELKRIMVLYSVVALATLLLEGTVAMLVVGRLLRPIGVLRRAADDIDESDLTSRVTVRGRDDLAGLAGAFNRMLDRVQRAVEGRNALLDDVGHELRTPITVVRGHLELLDPNDPADVAETREVAIDELDRMGRLVNDLLVLASSQSEDFVVPVECDLGQLTTQVADKACALGARQWQTVSIAQGTVVVDPARVTQAWLQLAGNAVKYSDKDSLIQLGSRVEDGQVFLWVEDEGIGIAAGDLERVRQRFERTDEAKRRRAGSGLGLDIVESIVAAHGGTLQIASLEGRGSRFTMCLPTRIPADTSQCGTRPARP